MDKSKRAVAYARVSTSQQEQSGHSLAAQQAEIERYCQYERLDLVHLYVDADVSGTKELRRRPEASAMFKRLEQGDIGHVVALKLDRLFRNALDCLGTVQQWEQAGIALHFIEWKFDTTTAHGKMFLTIAAAFAEMEAGQVKERVNRVVRHLKASNRPYCGPMYGARYVDGQRLDDPADLRTFATIDALRGQGLSHLAIANYLNENGFPTKRGGKWHARQVIDIAKRIEGGSAQQ